MKTSTRTPKISLSKELEKEALNHLKQVKKTQVNSFAYALYLSIGVNRDMTYQEFKRVFGSALVFAIALFPAAALYCKFIVMLGGFR